MPWFKVTERAGEIHYLHSTSKEALLCEFITQQNWAIEVAEWNPKKLNYRTLLVFYEELYSALQSGIQIKEAISHLGTFSSKADIALICSAIVSELEKGRPLNTTLMKLVEPPVQAYCKLVNTNSTKEACLSSLEISIKQLRTLLDWSQRLLKSLLYPFFLIQLAIIILMINFLVTYSLTEHLINFIFIIFLYALCSLTQLALILSFQRGDACHWLERYSSSFRLNKFFSLLNTIRNTGCTLQEGVWIAAQHFTYHRFKLETLTVYYKLRLGNSYIKSFPQHWFPKSSSLALHSTQYDGDIERALTLAKIEHEKSWNIKIQRLERILPALCLLIAAGFVTHTIIKLYLPLLKVA
ncbi:type II secretion system F family protein [Marinomonas sp. C2222]|uniref:Type II secretion system F family protein n=1 Tax=Marinomonas sargassi TaxID=2984494 RepID=A0ABT2YSN8_9GAMM|nr:type II secretion system F family protein [Marinomonas sargassi]MCV2402892.1 type II secretion system F family protein [Marinomonas sargassi]